jgi:hypothetical protein
VIPNLVYPRFSSSTVIVFIFVLLFIYNLCFGLTDWHTNQNSKVISEIVQPTEKKNRKIQLSAFSLLAYITLQRLIGLKRRVLLNNLPNQLTKLPTFLRPPISIYISEKCFLCIIHSNSRRLMKLKLWLRNFIQNIE